MLLSGPLCTLQEMDAAGTAFVVRSSSSCAPLSCRVAVSFTGVGGGDEQDEEKGGV